MKRGTYRKKSTKLDDQRKEVIQFNISFDEPSVR